MLGLRYDHTMTDTGNVQSYNNFVPKLYYRFPELYSQPPDLIQANAFNAQDHQRDFDTFDVTALMQFTPQAGSQYDFGYARKNRAPSLHELYPWDRSPMMMTMVGWFGDGNGYVGNMGLKPETAHNISFTADFYDPKADAWGIKVTLILVMWNTLLMWIVALAASNQTMVFTTYSLPIMMQGFGGLMSPLTQTC